MPSLKLGEAVHVYVSDTDIRGFVEFTFDEPIYLTKGSTYWFALTVHNEQNSAHKIFMDFHVDYNHLNGDVLEASDDTWGELPATAPTGGALDFSDRAIWYRLSGPNPEESADSEESESSFDSAAMEISP